MVCARHRGVDFVDKVFEIGFDFLPWAIAELFHAGQDFYANHFVAIHFFFLDEAVTQFVVLVKRLLYAFGADVFAIGEDNEVLDTAHDVHVAIFIEADEVAGLHPSVWRQGLCSLFGFAVIAEEDIVATEPQFTVHHLGFLLGIELSDRGGSFYYVDICLW